MTLVVAAASPAIVTLVLDTNIWLDWLVFDDPSVAGVKHASRQAGCRIVATGEMRAELAAVLARLARLSRPDRTIDAPWALERFDATVVLCDEAPHCTALRCHDRDDQMFIDLAVAQRARCLYSKDKALLKLARAARQGFGLSILRPSDADRDLLAMSRFEHGAGETARLVG